MMSKEILSAPEDIDWTPAANIRLHHAQQWIPMGKLVVLSYYFRPSAYRSMVRSQYRKDYGMYKLDAYGKPGSDENLLQEQETNAFYEMLNGLSDNTVVQLDSAPDGLCAACPVGKHCTATNFKDQGYLGETEKFEGKALRRIKKELLKKGFRQEVDFKLIETETTMLDYQGQHLWTRRYEDATPITVVSDAMVVKMGALRSIADIGSLNTH